MAATTTEVKEKLDLALNALAGELTDLPSILEDEQSGELSSIERDVRAMEWGQVMGTLRTILYPAYRSGQMTPEQATRYRLLLQRLKEAMPVIERLGFAKPSISLDP